MTLADTGAWMAVLSRVGPVLLSVTSSLQMDFLRRPALDVPLWADAELVKLGRSLAVVRVTIWSAHPPPIATTPPSHASGSDSAIDLSRKGDNGNANHDCPADRAPQNHGDIKSDADARQAAPDVRIDDACIPSSAPVAIATVTYAIPPPPHTTRTAKL